MRERRSGRLTGTPGHVRGEALRSGFEFTVLALAGVLLFTAFRDSTQLPFPQAVIVVPAWAAGAAIYTAVGVMRIGGRLPTSSLPAAVGVLSAVGAVVSGVSFTATGDKERFVSLLLAMLGGAALLAGARWVVLNTALCGAAFVGAAVLHPGSLVMDRADDFCYGLVLTALVAVHRLRGMRQTEALADGLAAQADTDTLTGLLNRRGLDDAVRDVLTAAGGQPSVGILWLDLDGFKRVNDDLGHSFGDSVLVDVAQRLTSLVRRSDLVSRVGGDEFVVIMPGATPAAVDSLAERVEAQLRGQAGILEIPWSVSVGTAHGPVSDDTAVQELLHRADLAMFAHKQERKSARPAGALTPTENPAPSVVD